MRRTVPGSKWRGQVFGIPRILRSSGRSLKLRKTSAAVGGVVLDDVNFPNGFETLWSCSDVQMDHVKARGDYFAMNSQNMVIRDFQLVGNYPLTE
mgnify:CR=1 FL=1